MTESWTDITFSLNVIKTRQPGVPIVGRAGVSRNCCRSLTHTNKSSGSADRRDIGSNKHFDDFPKGCRLKKAT
ncbi:MAG: hypothetical protein WCY99_00665 [Candidatus Neomarinimicrobiota bacterium]|nr:hypothetical protein [Candidatus Neomarinimicrobiota bacterium]